MVVDAYTALLEELGKSLGGIELTSDKNNTCLIHLKDGIEVQIELDHKGDSLLIGSDLGEVPVGRYRENLFREALKANGLPSPIYGILAFSQRIDHLILYTMLPLKDLNGEKISAFLTPFALKAKVWKDAIERGEVPVVQSAASGPAPPAGIFGLMR
jgi:hypothetical protein